jgi:hypothetical protein
MAGKANTRAVIANCMSGGPPPHFSRAPGLRFAETALCFLYCCAVILETAHTQAFG